MGNSVNELIEQIGRERLVEIREFTHTNGIENCNRQEWQIMARALLAVLDAQEEPVAFYANGAYYNTKRAALKDGAESVMPLYATPPAASKPVSKAYKLPDGWKLVPFEATRDMVWAGKENLGIIGWESFQRAYKAMLAAAPEPGGE